MVNLNDLVKVNYKNVPFSAGIINVCAESLSLGLYGHKNYKKAEMPPIFWQNYQSIENDYKLINKELQGVQSIADRLLICHKYPSLKSAWNEMANPSGEFSALIDTKEFEPMWDKICSFYPELKILSTNDGAQVIKSSYEKHLFNGNKGFPSFETVSRDFSLWIDRGERFAQAAIAIRNIFDRVSKAA